jgi:hypothetical protein
MTEKEMFDKAVAISYQFRKALKDRADSGVNFTSEEVMAESNKMLTAIKEGGPEFEKFLFSNEEWFEEATRLLE